MGFMAAIFNQLPGLVAPADHGTFSPPAPAGMSHPKVKCTQGNHTAKIEENGLAVMGAPMKPKTGKHWVEFRVLDASVPAGAHLGVVPEGLLSSDKAAVLGGAPGSIGIQGEARSPPTARSSTRTPRVPLRWATSCVSSTTRTRAL